MILLFLYVLVLIVPQSKMSFTVFCRSVLSTYANNHQVAGIDNKKPKQPEEELRRYNEEIGRRPLKSSANISRMKTLLERYSQCLPQPTTEAAPSNDAKTVAIIGSTGFLGPHIIACLLRKRVGCKIFCLNRSVDGERRTMSALRGIISDISTSLSQLQFFVTNIMEPNFGLETVQANMLASEVGEFVFNAWDPNWSLPLEHFRPFLMAIRNTVDFCAFTTMKPRITFVSSICAVGNWPRAYPTEPYIPERIIWDSHTAMEHGYGESKCVAEQLLARAHEASGLPIAIVRAGQIGGPSSPELGTWPRQGWLYSIIRTSKMLGCFPTHVQLYDFLRAVGSGREYDMYFQNEQALKVLPEVVPITNGLLVTWLRGWELELDSSKGKKSLL